MSPKLAVTLALPSPERAAVERFVADHFSHLVSDEVAGSLSFPGGQAAADKALAAFSVASFAQRRTEVFPEPKRGASRLSPYIRHGLLPLSDVWDHVADGPARDVDKFRDELMWQEFARHWYARLGARTKTGLRNEAPVFEGSAPSSPALRDGWRQDMACLELTVDELEDDGWVPNQTRMWLASHWSVRNGLKWQDGEELFFRHLIDGSRAANRLGWQWTTGVGSSKAYGFSRWQVEKRAPGLCASCDLVHDCPIENWPADPALERIDNDAILKVDNSPAQTAGPATVERDRAPEAVWLTAESLGVSDPALAAHPDLPALFVFDEKLLASLQLSSKRLVFLVETLAELAQARPVEVMLGDPAQLLADRAVSVTFAPVPGFRRRAERIGPAELHPWPWLVRPSGGSVATFSAWRRSVEL